MALAVASGVLVVAAVIAAVVVGSRHHKVNPTAAGTATSAPPATSAPTTRSGPSTSSPASPATTAPADQQKGDEAQITQLFSGINAAWAAGRDQGIAFTVAHTYPGLAQTLPACQADIPPGETQSYRLDTATFAPSPSFQAKDGDDLTVHVDGRIYQVMATVTVTDPGKGPAVTTTAVHATVAPDGSASIFFLC